MSIDAIVASSADALLAVAVIILALKYAAVAPELVAYGKAQVQAQLNQQTAENERDQEKALREETEAELADCKAKLAAAEKALAACGAKESVDDAAKVAAAPNVHVAVADALGELSAGMPAAGGAGSAARGDQAGAAGAVPAAAAAKPADGAGK